MSTTIQISNNIRKILENQKLNDKDSMNDILERILEDCMEFTDEFKKGLDESKKEADEGRLISFEEIKKKHI